MASSWTVLENNPFSSPNDRPHLRDGRFSPSMASNYQSCSRLSPPKSGISQWMKQPEKNIQPSEPASEPGSTHCFQVASQTSSEGEPDVKPLRFTPKGIRSPEIWDLHMGKPHPMDSLQDIHGYSLLWNGLWLVMAGVFGIKPDLTSKEMKPGSSPLFAISITPKNIPVHLPLTVSLDGRKI